MEHISHFEGGLVCVFSVYSEYLSFFVDKFSALFESDFIIYGTFLLLFE